MNHTKIEWVQNPDGTPGYTWNPITGCLNHVNGLCKGGGFPCYAYRLAHGRLKPLYERNMLLACDYDGKGKSTEIEKALDDPFYPRFWPERLGDLGYPDDYGYQQVNYPKGIFVCDMGEFFGDWIPTEWQYKILRRIQGYPEHRFYLLTKQPQSLAKFSPFPSNCYVGVTVTSNAAMTLAMTNLANIQAKVKYISFEPLLGSIGMNDHMSMKGIVDWVIIGAQTKPYKPPRIEWVKEIVVAADRGGIPVFLKDNLAPLLKKEGWSPAWAINAREPDGSREYLRQEMPQK